MTGAQVADIKRGRLSDAERSSIFDFAERGLTAGQIALRLNRHPGTINYAMTTLGLKAPAERQFAYQRNGRAVRSFSADEDAFIQALRCQSYRVSEIARIAASRFGYARTPATINTRLRQLASKAMDA